MMEWDDDIQGTTGTTHVRSLPNGDMVGICSEIITSGDNIGENQLTAYRVNKENINKRIRLGSVPTGKCSVYQHAFGLSENYVTIFQHPIKTDMGEQLMGADMITCMKQVADESTLVHAIKIGGEDAGKITTYDTGNFF